MILIMLFYMEDRWAHMFGVIAAAVEREYAEIGKSGSTVAVTFGYCSGVLRILVWFWHMIPLSAAQN